MTFSLHQGEVVTTSQKLPNAHPSAHIPGIVSLIFRSAPLMQFTPPYYVTASTTLCNSIHHIM